MHVLLTGTVTPYVRKREIYQICREYNITIIEDDAYYYLQYPALDGEATCAERMHMLLW